MTVVERGANHAAMITFMHITLNTLKTVRFVIKLHLDWTDEVVANFDLNLPRMKDATVVPEWQPPTRHPQPAHYL